MIARLRYIAKAVTGYGLAALAFLAAPEVVGPLAALAADGLDDALPWLEPHRALVAQIIEAQIIGLAVGAGVYAVRNGPRPA